MEFIKFMFSGFWIFLGCLVLISMVLTFVLTMYNRTFRHWNIRKYGYPPIHCNADGDFKKEKDDE